MTDLKTIECKPSKWFKIRAAAIVTMLLFFSLWFFKDGYFSYREKNAAVIIKQVFIGENEKSVDKADFVVKALAEFKKKEYTAETWAEFAKEQIICSSEHQNILPRDHDFSATWPEEIVNGYDQLKKSEMYPLWNAYSNRTGLPISPDDNLKDEDTIRNQFITCGICVACLLYALFFNLRIMGRSMIVTPTGYTPPGGKEILYAAMRKIDKRKWQTKGLAFVHYEENGQTKIARVDGMVYGHFNVEDGMPAEALFTQIMANFKGEVLDFIKDDGDEEIAAKENA